MRIWQAQPLQSQASSCFYFSALLGGEFARMEVNLLNHASSQSEGSSKESSLISMWNSDVKI